VLIASLLAPPSQASFLGILAAAVLYFLGYPGPATATLLSTAVAFAISALNNFKEGTTIINFTRTRVVVVTVTNEVVRTEVLTLVSTKTVTETSSELRTVTITNTITLTKEVPFCGTVIELRSYALLTLGNFSKALCLAPPDVNAYVGRSLSVSTQALPGTPPTLIYLPQGEWRPLTCNRTQTLRAGETIMIARPYYGQSPEKVTFSFPLK
jgi:hypothetical protein